MATVYSLILWGGNSGKSVTCSDSGGYLLCTNTSHGARSGLAVRVSAATLPTGVSASTTYYVGYVSANTFYLYTSKDGALDGGTTDRVAWGGSGGSTVVAWSAKYAAPSTELAVYDLGDLSRWIAIYDSLSAWISGRSSASVIDEELAEIGDQLVMYSASVRNVTVPSGRNTITTSINGIRSDGFHNGRFGLGAAITHGSGSHGLQLSRTGDIVDGIEIYQTATGYAPYRSFFHGTSCVGKNLLIRSDTKNSTIGVYFAGTSSELHNSVVVGFNSGIFFYDYSLYYHVDNCLAFNNTAGFTYGTSGGYTGHYAYVSNCASIGNTTNWRTGTTQLSLATNNLGQTGDSVWDTTSSAVTTSDTSPFSSTFVDTSSLDFTPAAVTSALVEQGGEFFGNYLSDITGAVRPAYTGSAYGTDVTAGSFVAGLSYTIATVGSTDFTLIGAASNTVGVQFKATGVGSGTGTATLNARLDIGPFEFDPGYGPWPATQPVAVTDIVSGTRVKIAKQSDGTELYNDVPGTSLSYTESLSASTPVYVYARKGSAATYYHPLKLSATIDPEAGLSLSLAGLQNEDIAAHDYTSTAVATDWSFNLSTGAITHDSGTMRYSVRDLYSWHQDYTDGSTQVDDDPLMHGTTPTIFELINTGSISDADLEDLYGGSIEFPNGDLWTNLWTTNTMAAAHSVYVVQAGSKYTAFWGSGPIDVLLQVADAGTLRDSGLVDVYAREYGYTYAYYQADLSAGGRVVAPLATLEDATTQSISSATAAGYTDVGYTWGSTSQDLGEGGGAGTYYCRIDCAGRTLDQVFARTMYDCRDVSTTTLNGAAGWKYRKAHSNYVANDAAPFGNYSGGFWNVAQGVWLDNVASADQYNYKLTDHAGMTHQLSLPAGAATATVLDGSRVVLYNTTQATEIDNVLMSGSTAYSYTITTEADTNDVLTLFVFKEGYEEASANMIWSGTTQSFVISQETHPYIAALRTELSITDYTTITEFAPDTTGHVYIEADDVDGSSQKARAAIWYNGILTTEGGARYFRGGMTILSTAAFRVNVDTVDMLFENVNPSTALVFTDLSRRLYRSDGSSIIAPTSYSIHNDYSGVPDVVETGVSGLTGSESAQLMALPSASDIVTTAIDGTTTLAESLRLSNAVLGGKVSGAGTGTETFRDIADTVDRVVATVDSSGNRTAITLDLD